MSNYIKTSDIVDPNINQPFTGDDVDFWQALNVKNRTAIVRNIIGEQLYSYGVNTGNFIIISGCQKSTGGNVIFNGWLYNVLTGEIFFFPGAVGLNGFTQTAVFFTNQYADLTIDPVEFTDSVFRNVHFIREVYILDAAAGTGLTDLPNAGRIVTETEILCSDTLTSSAALTPITGASFTSPNRICDMEITIEGDIAFDSTGAPESGGELQIYNSTTSALLQKTVYSVANLAATTTFKIPAHVTKVYRNIPANTVIHGNIIRIGAADIVIRNCVMTYREILPPPMW